MGFPLVCLWFHFGFPSGSLRFHIGFLLGSLSLPILNGWFPFECPRKQLCNRVPLGSIPFVGFLFKGRQHDADQFGVGAHTDCHAISGLGLNKRQSTSTSQQEPPRIKMWSNAFGRLGLEFEPLESAARFCRAPAPRRRQAFAFPPRFLFFPPPFARLAGTPVEA